MDVNLLHSPRNLANQSRGVMSLTAEALKKLGSEAAEGAAKEAKDWETVSASAYESLDCVDKRALSEVKMLPATFVPVSHI